MSTSSPEASIAADGSVDESPISVDPSLITYDDITHVDRESDDSRNVLDDDFRPLMVHEQASFAAEEATGPRVSFRVSC